MRNIMNVTLPITEANPIYARSYDYENFTFPWHFHSQYEIMYVKESTGFCFAGDCIKEFADGFLILFGSNLPHHMKSSDIYKTGDKSLRVKGTIIHFEKDFMLHSINHYPQFRQVNLLLKKAQRGVYFPKAVSEGLDDLIEAVLVAQGAEQIIRLLSLLQRMTLSERCCLASPIYNGTPLASGNNRIDKIITFINSNYTRHIDLKEISSMAAMNPSAFCRFFKENTSKTLVQYITDMRIGYACKLLVLKELNMTQICMECGFDSVTHFNRIFKQATRFTPTQYQRNILAPSSSGTFEVKGEKE